MSILESVSVEDMDMSFITNKYHYHTINIGIAKFINRKNAVYRKNY